MTRTTEEISADLERILTEHLAAHTTETGVVLTNYILKATGIATTTSGYTEISTYSLGEQSIYQSIGLATTLLQDINDDYTNGYDHAEPEED